MTSLPHSAEAETRNAFVRESVLDAGASILPPRPSSLVDQQATVTRRAFVNSAPR